MNAFQLLKNDHKIVSDLFDEIETSSGRAKTELFMRLKSELDVHASVEEKIFYPALENKQESREITLEAYEEHKVVKDLLAELAKGSAADEEWDAKLKVLRENVDHHVEEEEGELFDKADDVLSDEDIERLGNEMEAEKARQQGLTPPRGSRATKGRSKKSAGSSKQADSPSVLKRLANLVGLGKGSSKGASKASSKAGKKKSAKASKKSSRKVAAKKSGARKAVKVSKSVTSGKSMARKGSKSGSKKSTKRSGVSKRSGSGSKKR